MAATEDLVAIAAFTKIGLKEVVARETSRNKKKSKILTDVINEVCISLVLPFVFARCAARSAVPRLAFHSHIFLWYIFISPASHDTQAGMAGGCEEALGNLLYSVAMSLPEASWSHRPTLLGYLTRYVAYTYLV